MPAEQPAPPEDRLYSYAIIRADLDMPSGKLAAQAGHALCNSLLQFIAQHPERLAEFLDRGGSGSRVLLRARHLADLERARDEAVALGLPCYLMVDTGHVLPPHFDGSTPVPTALGIGPCTRDAARPVVKRFRCL